MSNIYRTTTIIIIIIIIIITNLILRPFSSVCLLMFIASLSNYIL